MEELKSKGNVPGPKCEVAQDPELDPKNNPKTWPELLDLLTDCTVVWDATGVGASEESMHEGTSNRGFPLTDPPGKVRGTMGSTERPIV